MADIVERVPPLKDMVRLSLLDRSRTRVDENPAMALHGTVDRAQRAEDLGYYRYWVAEHHAVPGIASGSPPLLIAAIAAHTSRIRVGSGGVMLPNHQPIIVAEQFAMLEALYPGRIDLGMGRSLGFTAPVREALGVTAYGPAQFAEDLDAVREFLVGAGPVTVTPELDEPPPMFVLATGRGLEAAAGAGLPVVVGGPVLAKENGPIDGYRRDFRASAVCPEPYVIISVEVMIADTAERARDLLLPEAWAMADARTAGAFPPLSPVESVQDRVPTNKQRRTLDASLDGAVYGTAREVEAALVALVERTGADEVMATTSTYDRDDLARADTAIAELFGVS